MALSIKNQETCLAVAKLASVTGLNITEAIRQAVEEKLARTQSGEGRTAHILAIGSDCASRLPKSLKNREHGDILFGSDGLPA